MNKKILFVFCCGLIGSLSAAVDPAPLFNHNLVLQRGQKVPVWGRANAGESVVVSFAGQTLKSTADANGRWRVDLAPLSASSEPRTLKIGSQAYTNVVVGEVWLCSGQSNMSFELWQKPGVGRHSGRERNGYYDALLTDDPLVRAATVGLDVADRPKAIKRRSWVSFVPANFKEMCHVSAVGFHYALRLRESLKVPVGIVVSAWGGSHIEPWIAPEGYLQSEHFVSNATSVVRMELTPEEKERVEERRRKTGWGFPQGVLNHQPRSIYYAMIAPLEPYAMRGVIWYQGEANQKNWEDYYELLTALKRGWAKTFENPDMAFYLAQIAPYNYGNYGSCRIREEMARFGAEEPNCGTAILSDVGELDNIHPGDKRTVGTRLAALALNRTYGLRHVPFAVAAAEPVEVVFEKPVQRWLWGGFGFHNSEATMLPMMSQEFRDERVYKTFREISPTYSRVFAGYADWTKEAMDSFADFYDATFRRAGTTIYMVPGRFPYVHRDFDAKDHFERIATNLAYLVKVRKLTKLRYYAIANELSAGNVCCWFDRAGKMDLYRDYCEEAYCAFRRHGLDIGLQTTDRSSSTDGIGGLVENIKWAIGNVDEFTDTYCWHVYDYSHRPGEPGLYEWMYTNSVALVKMVGRKEKRISLGEYGLQGRPPQEAHGYGSGVMRDDGTFSFRYPDKQNLAAISQVEMALGAINAGMVSAVKWTLFDYPQPFLRENGDTAAEKARYDVSRFSGHGLQIRYNKCGLIAWNDDDHDYSARADLYTLGYLAKFFRKGGRILPSTGGDALLIASGITNPDGSATYALINWGEARDVRVKTAHPVSKPLRLYVYDSAKPPYSAFNDLQPASGTVRAKDGMFTVKMQAQSLVFATTDYQDREPTAVEDVRMEGGRLSWRASDDPDHVYYRVFSNGVQIASTVATFFERGADASSTYDVRSVDRWGNVGASASVAAVPKESAE